MPTTGGADVLAPSVAEQDLFPREPPLARTRRIAVRVLAFDPQGRLYTLSVPTLREAAFEQITGNLCRDEKGQYVACGEGPNIYKAPEDVKPTKGWGNEVKYVYTKPDGSLSAYLAPGPPIPRNELPETLYHATTDMGALVGAPFLKGQFGQQGLGGGSNPGVSLTTRREDAALIARELRRGHDVVAGAPAVAYAAPWMRSQLERYAREDEQRAGVATGSLQPVVDGAMNQFEVHLEWTKNHKPETTNMGQDRPAWDAFRYYLTGRDHWGSSNAAPNGEMDKYNAYRMGTSPLRNPLLMTDVDRLKALDPRKIGVIEVPRSGIPERALILPGSDDWLHEIRVHADVPIKAPGGAELYSPNVAEEARSTADKAERDRTSERFRAFERVAKTIDEEVGITAKQESAYGDWNGGSEASIMARIEGDVPWEQLRYAAALKGLAGHQKAVAVFRAEPGGADAFHEFTLPGMDWRAARTVLASRGIENRTLIPTEGGTRVALIDPGGALLDKVFKIGEDYDVGIRSQVGRADFLGDFDDRNKAAPVFEREIAQFIQAHPDGRHARVRHPDRSWLVEARRRWRDLVEAEEQIVGNLCRDEQGRYVACGEPGAVPVKADEKAAEKPAFELPKDWKKPDLSSGSKREVEDLRDWLAERKLPPETSFVLSEALWQALTDEQRADLGITISTSMVGNRASVSVTLQGGEGDGDEDEDHFGGTIESWDDVVAAGREDEAFRAWSDDTREEFIDSERDAWWDSDEPKYRALNYVAQQTGDLRDLIAEKLVEYGATQESVDRIRHDNEVDLIGTEPTAEFGSHEPYLTDTDSMVNPEVYDRLEFQPREDLDEDSFEPGERWPPYGPPEPEQQQQLPGMPPRPTREELHAAFAEQVNEAVAEALKEEAQNMVDRYSDHIAPDNDYFTDSIDELQSQIWSEYDGDERWRHVERHFEGETYGDGSRSSRYDALTGGNAADFTVSIYPSDTGPGQPASMFAHVDHLYLRPDMQGKGIATRLIGTVGQLAPKLGVSSIGFDAVSNGGAMVGAYTWAKLGFSPSDTAQWGSVVERFKRFAEARGGDPPIGDMTPYEVATYEANGRQIGKDFLTGDVQWTANVAKLPGT